MEILHHQTVNNRIFSIIGNPDRLSHVRDGRLIEPMLLTSPLYHVLLHNMMLVSNFPLTAMSHSNLALVGNMT
jgi:hypothetical protein